MSFASVFHKARENLHYPDLSGRPMCVFFTRLSLGLFHITASRLWPLICTGEPRDTELPCQVSTLLQQLRSTRFGTDLGTPGGSFFCLFFCLILLACFLSHPLLRARCRWHCLPRDAVAGCQDHSDGSRRRAQAKR